MKCLFESSCFIRSSEIVKQNPAKSCALYVVIMAIFVAVMLTRQFPLETRAIVGYSMAALHGALLIIGIFYIKNKISAQRDANVQREPLQARRISPKDVLKEKQRADLQMREMFALPEAQGERQNLLQGEIERASYANGQITFDKNAFTHSVMEGSVIDPGIDDGSECIFYVVRCTRISTKEVFVLTFVQREFLSGRRDGEFYIQGNYPPELFKQEFSSFTAPNLEEYSTRLVRFKKLLAGQLKDFRLV